MTYKQMRLLDGYIGSVICLILTILDKSLRVFYVRKQRELKGAKKILITKYFGMGSILLATPMVRALRENLPGSRITLLTLESNRQFAEKIDLFDGIESIRTSNIWLFIKDVLAVMVKNIQQRFDVVLDLEFFPRFSTIVSYMTGARTRIGYYLPKLWRGALLTHPIHFNPHKHVMEIFSAQLEPFGIEVTNFSLQPLDINHNSANRVSSLLAQKGLNDGELIVPVNVNASELCVERRWPRENFVELISHIVQKRNNLKIVLIGLKDDREYVENIYNLLSEQAKKSVIDVSGDLDIEELIALLKKSHLFITNDSGPLHIASALGVSTVAFFGPESPILYSPPQSDKKNLVFYSDIYCSPCLNVYNAKTAMCNGDNRCMKEITVSQVIEAIDKEKLL